MIDYLMSLNPVLLAFIACLFTYAFTALGAAVVIFFKNVNRNVMDAIPSLSLVKQKYLFKYRKYLFFCYF